LTDDKKLAKLALLAAFRDFVEMRIEDDFSDINTILQEAAVEKNVILISDKRC
jgi:hypothetical protein